MKHETEPNTPIGEALGRIDRVKSELASLRGALLRRGEDPGGLSLAIDRLRGDLAAAKSEIEALKSEASSLRTESLALGERIGRVEHAARRFEVFYDSPPLRWLRKGLLGIRGLVRR